MDDKRYMARALELARKGLGFTHPNPMVGSVVVRNGRVVGEGYHRAYGKAHAEVEALRQAGSRARGATLYVNLEPCAHWGKTPPCMIAVVGAGIRKVVAAMGDPNPKVAGKGFAFLKQHGVQVTRGVLEREAADLNKAFLTRITQHRPFVTLKAGVSLNGTMTAAPGDSKWITSSAARRRGHRFRAQVDAIAVGLNTVLVDDPALTAHGQGRNPKRIIFDSWLRISLKAHVLSRSAPTWIFTTSRAPQAKRRALERKGISVYVTAKTPNGRVSLPEAVRVLAREGITHLLVEGGNTLNRAFLEAGLVDEVLWFIAPKIIAGAGKRVNAWTLKNPRWQPVGEDMCLTGRLK